MDIKLGYRRIIKALGVVLLSCAGAGNAQAGLITLTESFSEFGSQSTLQTGFNWQFTGLAPATGPLTIQMDWVRMDFDLSSEIMNIFADANLLGSIGNSAQQTCVNANSGTFAADCTGTATFTGISAALILDSALSITSTLPSSNVNSSGGSTGSPLGFITATLSYNVPEPATLAILGLGLAGFGFSRRKLPAA